MSDAVIQPTSTVYLNNVVIPFKSWHTTAGTNGAIGTCRIVCGKKALAGAGITPDQLKGTEPIDIFVNDGRNGNKHIFGGNHDDSDTDPTGDEVEITGRDPAAVLRDASRAITTKAQQNLFVEQVVEELAGAFGLATNITPTGVRAGTIYKQFNLFSPKPRNAWAMIQLLAKAVGYEVYIQPNTMGNGGQLVFGPGGQNKNWTLTYMPGALDAATPIMRPHIRRNPRRNGSFKVFVLSSHPAFGLTQGSAQNVPSGGGAINFFNGAGSMVQIGAVLGALANGEQVYTYRVNGKTPDACSRLAQSIALDIAKREVIVTGTLDGNTLVQPRDSVSYVETRTGDLGSDVIGKTFTIAELNHSYVLESDPAQISQEGYTTRIKTLSLPSVPGGTLFNG